MKQISRIGFDSETPMEETILRQSTIDGIHFIDFKGYWAVLPEKRIWLLFRKISPGGIVEVNIIPSGQSCRGQLAELATLLMLNDELQQRSINGCVLK